MRPRTSNAICRDVPRCTRVCDSEVKTDISAAIQHGLPPRSQEVDDANLDSKGDGDYIYGRKSAGIGITVTNSL